MKNPSCIPRSVLRIRGYWLNNTSNPSIGYSLIQLWMKSHSVRNSSVSRVNKIDSYSVEYSKIHCNSYLIILNNWLQDYLTCMVYYSSYSSMRDINKYYNPRDFKYWISILNRLIWYYGLNLNRYLIYISRVHSTSMLECTDPWRNQ